MEMIRVSFCAADGRQVALRMLSGVERESWLFGEHASRCGAGPLSANRPRITAIDRAQNLGIKKI